MAELPASPWDVVVVGAGPAGSATALGALASDPSLRVLLLDRDDFPRDKTCGDGIAPHVFDALAEVGVRGVEDGWEPLRRLELARGRSRVRGNLARPVWVIPREVLDARLVERATAAGAELRRHRVHGVRHDSSDPAAPLSVDDVASAAVVVGADGPHSVVRHAAGLGRTTRRALALRGYVPTAPSWAGSQVIRYGDRRQPSYAWAFDRGDGLTNVGYGELLGSGRDETDTPSRAILLEQLERLLPGATTDGQGWKAHHLPLSGARFEQPDGAVLLAGDAANLVNPMTGEGIYYAVATGILAGRAAAAAIAAGDPATAGTAYRDDVRRLLGRHLRHTAVAARLSAVPAAVDAGIRAASRSRGVFDDLVELGLGRGRITPRLGLGLATHLPATLRAPRAVSPTGGA